MMKRTTINILFLAALFWIGGLQAHLLPIAVANLPSQAISTLSDSTVAPALWVRDGTYGGNLDAVTAIDPQTGEELLRVSSLAYVPQDYTPQVTSTDGRWKYMAQSVLVGKQVSIAISKIDLVRGKIEKVIEFRDLLGATSAKSSQSTLPDASLRLALSNDNHTLALVVTSNQGLFWNTNLVFIDATLDRAPGEMWLGFSAQEADRPKPSVATILSDDGSKWAVVQYRQPSSNLSYLTEVAVISLNERKVEAIKDVSTSIQAQDYWMNAWFSPDAKTLYLLQPTFQGASGYGAAPTGYRFAALNAEQLDVLFTKEVQQSAGGEPFCASAPSASTWLPRMTADGRNLYGYCRRDVDRPIGYFQFLDTQTAIVSNKVLLQLKAQLPNLDESNLQMIESPDKKYLYVIHPVTKEIAILDVDNQTIARSVTLQELDQVGTGRVKEFSTPTLPVISPDGKSLYFVGQTEFDANKGIWAVETGSLRLIGNWLKDMRDISGLRLSPDGNELYVLNLSEHTLYALDALTGQIRRSFDKVLKKPYRFAW